MTKPAHRRGYFNPRDNHTRIRAWTANPDTRCHAPGCGKTLAAHPPHTTGRPATWTNGHPANRPGDPTAPLQPWASTCNTQDGGRLTPRGTGTTPTRNWLTP